MHLKIALKSLLKRLESAFGAFVGARGQAKITMGTSVGKKLLAQALKLLENQFFTKNNFRSDLEAIFEGRRRKKTFMEPPLGQKPVARIQKLLENLFSRKILRRMTWNWFCVNFWGQTNGKNCHEISMKMDLQ